MGDSQNDPLRVDFDRQIKLEFHGSTVTSDAGLLAYRELDDALRLTSTAATGLHDTRTGQNTQHSLLALLRQSIYSRLAGYEDVNDAERLCLDPALRTVVGGRAKDNTGRFHQRDGPLRDRDPQHQGEPQVPDGPAPASGSTRPISTASSTSSSSTWTVR